MYVMGLMQAVKIALGYFLLIILLPALILGERFKKEDITKRVMIYLVFGNIYVSTLVFGLAYLKLFSRSWLVLSLVLTSSLLYLLFNRKQLPEKILNTKMRIRELFLGEYGYRVFFSDILKKAKHSLKKLYYELFYENKIEWLFFISILFYSIYQYGINSIEFTTYMAPDEEVHLYWIQSLLQGNIYPSGVYPHVFHTLLAAMITLYKFSAVDMIIYFGATLNLLVMTMLYIGMRKLFKSKYAALLGFMLYSILDIYLRGATYRFQFTIPQEYAMMFLLPMAIFLFAYIKEQKVSDLAFFVLALALPIGIHFYTGVIAVILAVAIGVTYLYKIIKEKMLGKLILAGLLSAVVALAPLGIGLATGYELEQSFTWGAEVIKGDVYSTTSDGVLKEELEPEEESALTLDQFLVGAKRDIERYVVHDVEIMYVLLSILLISLVFNLFYRLSKKEDAENEYQIAFALNNLLLLLLILFKSLNLPTLMEPKRVAIYFAYFSAIILGTPLELISRLLSGKKLDKALPALSIGIILSSALLVLRFDLLRPIPPLYYFQPTGTTLTDMKIIEEYEDFTWTAISPVNNISMIMNNGYHYELNEFILAQENWNSQQEIRIPSEQVFLFIEKEPIIYYGNRFYRGDYELENRPEITKEDAQKELSEATEENYHYIKERTILMAKAYAWAEEYQRYFPKEMEVYYEDEELIVYRIKQNVNALNNFSIDYGLNSR